MRHRLQNGEEQDVSHLGHCWREATFVGFLCHRYYWPGVCKRAAYDQHPRRLLPSLRCTSPDPDQANQVRRRVLGADTRGTKGSLWSLGNIADRLSFPFQPCVHSRQNM